jgi:hypothetical protein
LCIRESEKDVEETRVDTRTSSDTTYITKKQQQKNQATTRYEQQQPQNPKSINNISNGPASTRSAATEKVEVGTTAAARCTQIFIYSIIYRVIYTHTKTHTHTYIYIYIYIEREREKFVENMLYHGPYPSMHQTRFFLLYMRQHNL